jgi:uncharacterized membrane protein
MLFIGLMVGLAALAWIPQAIWGDRRDLRMAMRHGAAGAFLFTGIDHFINTSTRYVPMIPDFLLPWAKELVWISGAGEIAGAIGLLPAPAFYARYGLPNLRYWAAVALSTMLCFLVIANVNLALKGGTYGGREMAAWYLWLRPFLQPAIILWILYAGRVIGHRRCPPAET